MSKKKTKPIPSKNTNKKESESNGDTKIVLKKNQRYLWYCISLFVFGFILYGFSIDFGYVLDDNLINANNKFVVQGVHGIPDILTHGYLFGTLGLNDSYRPLLMIHLAIEKELFGLNPAVNHFFNVFYYGITGVLLFLLLCKIFKNTKALYPFLMTLLFMAHPLHTEVVANIKS